MGESVRCVIGLGSNIGDRLEHLLLAVRGMHCPPAAVIIKSSSVYETEPVGDEHQAWFLNAVIEIDWLYSADKLLAYLQTIENKLGRNRLERWGPRIIDIDILSFGDMIINAPSLQIPHPRMKERRFVLEPLAELNADWRYPGTEISASQLLHDCQDTHAVVKVDTPEILWYTKA